MLRPALSALRGGLRAALPVALLCASASAHITVEYPNGGEVFRAGQVVPIRWRITLPHGQVGWQVRYSTVGPMGPWNDVALDLPPGSVEDESIHTYDWVVPEDFTQRGFVRVTMVNPPGVPNYNDKNNHPFTIAPCAEPETYCDSLVNSSGRVARIGWEGSPNVSANDLRLTVSGVPPMKPGVFFYGGAQLSEPFGEGLRCVGSGGAGVFRLEPVVFSDSLGRVDLALDLDLPPANAGPGQIAAGDLLNFQLWYRDPAGGPAGFNTSDGLAVSFCP